MREIKFRCWNDVAKTMYPLEHFALTMEGKELQLMPACEHYDKPYLPNSSGHMIYMQYTGLKDKNGKEIYESDIVKYIQRYNNDVFPAENKVHEVVWKDGGFTYNNTWYDYDGLLYPEKWEVIGNIYENPELFISPS